MFAMARYGVHRNKLLSSKGLTSYYLHDSILLESTQEGGKAMLNLFGLVAEKRAARGARFLDKTYPAWAGFVRDIKMGSREACVLTQASKVASFSQATWKHNLSTKKVVRFGFFPTLLAPVWALNRAWKAEIAARLLPILPPKG